MSNAHLPWGLAWMSYRLKLWPGIRYGIATLATPLKTAATLLDSWDFKMLSFLGVNRHIKKGWRRLPRAFGGVGLLSFPIEQLIAWVGMLLQHFGVPSILGRKFQASLEALQLEIGARGNPLEESFAVYGALATDCWFKSVWERLDHYGFRIHLKYPTLEEPRVNDRLLASVYVTDPAWSEKAKISINRCRLAKKLMWLSDAVTADGRYLEEDVMDDGPIVSCESLYVFPREEPSRSDWKVWQEFLGTLVGKDNVLCKPLGVWIGKTGRK